METKRCVFLKFNNSSKISKPLVKILENGPEFSKSTPLIFSASTFLAVATSSYHRLAALWVSSFTLHVDRPLSKSIKRKRSKTMCSIPRLSVKTTKYNPETDATKAFKCFSVGFVPQTVCKYKNRSTSWPKGRLSILRLRGCGFDS